CLSANECKHASSFVPLLNCHCRLHLTGHALPPAPARRWRLIDVQLLRQSPAKSPSDPERGLFLGPCDAPLRAACCPLAVPRQYGIPLSCGTKLATRVAP